MASGKDIRQLIRAIESQEGFSVSMTKNSHYRVTREGYPRIVLMPSTPSEGRGFKNTIADLRRHLDFVYQGR